MSDLQGEGVSFYERHRCSVCNGSAMRGGDRCFQHDLSPAVAHQRAASHKWQNETRSRKVETRSCEIERRIRKSNAREIGRLRRIIAWCVWRLVLPPDSREGDFKMLAAARKIAAQVE